MKKFRTLLLLFLILPCMFLFGACSKPIYVVSVEKTSTDGTNATITITYSDGSTASFNVNKGDDGRDGTDGTDGKDGADANIEAIFKECVKRGLYADESNESFQKFLADYLAFEIEPNDEQAAINRATCSSVAIYSGNWKGNEIYNMCAGSGVIYKLDTIADSAYILTNYHVAYSEATNNIATYLTCYLYGSPINLVNNGSDYYPHYSPDRGALTCTYIGGAESYDLAILKVDVSDVLNANENARAITLASDYKVGETAIAIGNPEGAGISVTKGIVSVESENIKINSISGSGTANYRVMRIDTAINGGNSGGGLFNQKGELIGIVNAKIEDASIDNMAYALPLDNVTRVANNILDNYERHQTTTGVKKVLLGVSTQGANSRYVFNESTSEIEIVEDTVIVDVSQNSLAQNAGLKNGDILTAIAINNVNNKIDLTRSFQLGDLLLDVREGDTIWIYYTRQELLHTVKSSFKLTITEDMLQTIN